MILICRIIPPLGQADRPSGDLFKVNAELVLNQIPTGTGPVVTFMVIGALFVVLLGH